MISTRELRRQKTYNVRNRSDQPRQVLVEHPFDPNWTLAELDEPTERARDAYRFVVSVGAGDSEELEIVERRGLEQTIMLPDVSLDAIRIYLRSPTISPAVQDALGRVVAMRRDLEGTIAELQRRENRVQEIAQEQTRIRQNMEQLAPNSELHGRYVKILTDHEDELERIRMECEELRDRQVQQKRELDDFLLSLDVS